MKNVNTYFKITILALVLSACASGNSLFYNGRIIQKKSGNETVSNVSHQETKVDRAETNKMIQDAANESAASKSETNSVFEGDVASLSNELVVNENKRTFASNENYSILTSDDAGKVKISRVEKNHKTVMYEKKDSYKDFQKSSRDDVDKIVIIILCFFIPPLAVYLFEGSWTSRCTLNLILTLLCGLPGVIHALLVVLK